jgi:histidinol dehydrogenase
MVKLAKALRARGESNNEAALGIVREIIEDVKLRGDDAVIDYTNRFDNAALTRETLEVSQAEMDEAYKSVDERLLGIIRRAAKNIRNFHRKQLKKTWLDSENGRMTGQLIRAVERAGVYVPGGRAAYPSTVLMNIIPARVAGVEEIIMVTPAVNGRVEPVTLVAAREAGADRIFKIGGAQAVAALCFGTELIPKVDKITGPGNVYVALAKREVYGMVGIDMVAGPTEVLVVADENAKPMYVAADMLSQAEHDPMAAAILVTPSLNLARDVRLELSAQLKVLPRKNIAREAIDKQSAIVVTDTLDAAIKFANMIAPEHLELMVEDPLMLMEKVKNAGAIFLGENSPEPLGDYYAGPNHVLPTGGAARFASALSTEDFIKRISVINYSRDALLGVMDDIAEFAEAEGLGAHACSIRIRARN